MEKVYRIRIFSSFGDSSKFKETYERLCNSNEIVDYGIDKRIYITNGDDYTHVIIINTAMPVLPKHIPKQNVIGLAFEPPQYLGLTLQFIEYATKNIGKYFIGQKYDLPEPFTEHFSYMWHNPPSLEIPRKTKKISLMISEKMHASGHKYRHELVKSILISQLPIDIYGRGCQYYFNLGITDSRLKGEFEETEPYESYQYHICIENFQTNDYFSEKIVNSLLANTIPIYLGARNIETYFPNMIIHLSLDIRTDMELLRNLCKMDNPEIIIDIEKVKDTINLLKNIDTIFSFE